MWRTLIILAIFAGAYAIVPNVTQKIFRTELPVAKFSTYNFRISTKELAFVDASGAQLTLENFRGRYAIVNIWATWCPPCREEMASLDRLSALLPKDRIEVVPVSIDEAGIPVIRSFYAENKLTQLSIFNDTSGKIQSSLQVVGIPTTLLIDPDGREIGRMIGPAEWDAPESLRHIAEVTGISISK